MYKSSARGSNPVIWVCGHTAEGARTKESLGAYFYRDDIMASSHVGIDASGILQYVPYDRAAWTLRGGNPISDNAELCGFARWTRAQWLSTETVDGCANPRQILRNYAAWARSRCLARGIPLRKLTVAQVQGKQAGIIHHADYTQAFSDGSHWDMGIGVPWDVVLSDIQGPAQVTRKAREVMYIRCGTDIALLSGHLLIGLGSTNERNDAIRNMDSGAVPFQWVERVTWNAIDAQNKTLTANPRVVQVSNFPTGGV